MNEYIAPYTDEEMSTTTESSTTMDMYLEEQIPSTVEFTTYAEPLPSTMEIITQSASDYNHDYNTGSDGATSSNKEWSANAQFITPADDDDDD